MLRTIERIGRRGDALIRVGKDDRSNDDNCVRTERGQRQRTTRGEREETRE